MHRILLVGDDQELKLKFTEEFNNRLAEDFMTQPENEFQMAINLWEKPEIAIYQWLNVFITNEDFYKSQFVIIFWNRGWTNEKLKAVTSMISQVVSDEHNSRIFLLDVYNRFELKLLVSEFIDILHDVHNVTPATQYIQNRITFGDVPYVEVISLI